MFCAANGFHQNNAENVHSVAKRDARNVQYMVLYCNVLYILFCIGNCLVASFLLSVLTVSQSSQTYYQQATSLPDQRKVSKITGSLKIVSHLIGIIVFNRWAARAAGTEVCFFSEFLKALFQVYLDSLSVVDC